MKSLITLHIVVCHYVTYSSTRWQHLAGDTHTIYMVHSVATNDCSSDNKRKTYLKLLVNEHEVFVV